MDEDKVRDLNYRHAVAGRGIGPELANSIVGLLNAGDEDLQDQITKRYARIEADGFDRGPATTKRLEEMLEAIREVNAKVYKKAGAGLVSELEAIAAHEADFAAKSVKAAGGKIDFRTTIPDAKFLKTLVTTTPLPFSDDGHTLLMPWLATQEEGRLRRLEGALRMGALQGQSTGEIVQRIRGTKASGFTLGPDGRAAILQTSRKDATTIALTANAAIQNAARGETYNRMKTIHYVEWSSILDSRTSAICQGRSGKVYEKDKPHPTAPAHPRCFIGSTFVTTFGEASGDQIAPVGVSKRWFDGDVIIIRTASGKTLTGTPNHPILTRRGWVAMGFLNKTDDVVSYASVDGEAVTCNDHENVKTTIEEVANSFFASSQVATRKVPTTSEDFHGDGIDGEIAIIGTNRIFAHEPNVSVSEQPRQSMLPVRKGTPLTEPTPDSTLAFFLNRMGAGSSDFICALGQSPTLIGRHASHPGRLLFRSVADVNTALTEARENDVTGNAKLRSDGRDTNAAVVKADSFINVDDELTVFDQTTGLQLTVEDVAAYAKLSHRILNGGTGNIAFDSIVNISKTAFSGHVYNLETESEFYQAEGLIVHNCRSMLIPRRDNKGSKHKPYGEWLRDQPEGVQDDVLGKARADVFRANPDFDFEGFFKERGGYKSLGELRQFDERLFTGGGVKSPKKAAATPPPAPVAPEPPAKPARFSTPIDPDTSAATIEVQPKRQVVKSLSERLAENARDPRYDPKPEFRSIKDSDFGKASLSAGFTDEAASMVAALMPEVDAIADAFAIPRLRAVKSGSGSYIGTMGDGVLTLNPTYFVGYANGIGSAPTGSVAAKVIAQRDAMAVDLKAMADDIAKIKIAIRDATGADKDRLITDYLDKADVFNAKRGEWMKLDKKVLAARRTDRAASKPASTWKPGDDVAQRPFNAIDYFETPLDRARMVMFHEMAHAVHQMRGKRGRRAQVGKPPVEKHLAQLFFNKFNGAAPGNLGKGLEKKKLVASTYATTNEFEWFAENFGLYMMGRKDLVDSDVAELIERLLDEVSDGN